MHPLTGALAVGLGAAGGAWLRWALSLRLNGATAAWPMGTLASNLIGGYLVGVALAWFARHPDLAPHWKLLIVTGFLGGLTTFSTFSAEVVALLQQARWAMAAGLIGLHLAGSLTMTVAGFATVHALAR